MKLFKNELQSVNRGYLIVKNSSKSLEEQHQPVSWATIYPSADFPSLFIRHSNNRVEKLRANIATEPVTSTLITGTTTATSYSFEKSVTINSKRMYFQFSS